MKKVVFAVVLAAVLATGTAFADHPGGFGIGIQGGYGWGSTGGGTGALTLKFPSLPIFWAVNLGFGDHHFGLGLSGDYYIIDQALAAPIVHWFFGLGGFFSFYSWSHSSYTSYSKSDIALGLRIPIGLSLQPIPLLEFHLALVPGLGLYMIGKEKYSWGGTEYTHNGKAGFGWFMPLEIGLRLWF